jgi:hypothetical protein
VCVDRRFATDVPKVSRGLAPQLEAIRALPPGPACLAGKRIDLNRYEAALAELNRARERCQRHVDATQPQWTVHGRDVEGIHDRDYARCLARADKWIVLQVPGSTDPWIFAKPEIPDPPGPRRAKETVERCSRTTDLQWQVECIEREGWERLTPPR